MPVTPTYPGIYIEELPSSARTITAAPTSIAVFVGYTHPFKTKNFNKAVQIFNFTEYEREFGGFFENAIFDAGVSNFGSVAHAVNQFFINGGSVAYVVGVRPQATASGGSAAAITPASQNFSGITITPRELTDDAHPLQISITNRKKSDSVSANFDLADITVTYGAGIGSRVEIFRQVSLNRTLSGGKPNPDFIETRIGTASQPSASLITVSPTGANYPATFGSTDVTNQPLGVSPAIGSTISNVGDFAAVFQADQPLDKLAIFNLLIIPGVTNNAVLSAAIAFCERKQAFLIMDAPRSKTADPGSEWIGDHITTIPLSPNGALYFPYLKSIHPLTGQPIDLPPSGFVAGIYARIDVNRGVWKAPAGMETTLLNTTGVVEQGHMTDQRQGTLNPIGVNCLRSFPGVGTVVYGARTLVTNNPAYQQWCYVPVRRIALFIEQTLYRNLGWVVFEPNDEPLWIAIRTSIENFMLSLFNQGTFQGSKPSQAFQVKCDASTTTQTDIDNGIVNIIVAFAPLKPAEFVIVKIAQLAGQVQS